MDKNLLLQSLLRVKNTLNTIEIKGELNLDMMLGCIKTIVGLINEITKEGTPIEE